MDDISAPNKYKIDSTDYVNVVEPTSDGPGSFEVNVYCSRSVDPVTELRCTAEFNGETLNVILQDPNHVLPDDVYLKVTPIPKDIARWNELYNRLGNDDRSRILAFFDIELLYKSSGKPVQPMPLSNDVKMFFQIPNGWSKEDLKVILMMSGAENIEFENEVVNIDGVDYLVFWTKHFSPYALIGKPGEEGTDILNPKGYGKQVNRHFPQTGELDIMPYVIFGVLLVLSASIFIMTYNRRRKLD